MLLKGYRRHTRRVQNPLNPGRYSWESRLIPSGARSLSHDGKTYHADEDGWFDVPDEVGSFLRKGSYPGGERFLRRDEAREEYRLNNLDDDPFVDRPTPSPVNPAPAKRASRTARS